MNKVCSMKEAIRENLKKGDTLYLEGFTHLICFAAGHEIIRQGVSDLTLARLTPDLIYDQMIEAGLCKKLIFSWAGNPGVGSLHALRRVVEGKSNRSIELEEYSHHGMTSRLLAASSGLDFWPLNSYFGSDIKKENSTISEIKSPYSQKTYATVPALTPDLCIIHAQKSDKEGNAQVWGLMGTQKESAFAAKKVIVVAEEVVESSEIRQDPNRTQIPGFLVSNVVQDPWGCHPSYVQGYYDRDNDFYVQWDQISRSTETYQKYLDEFVYQCQDRREYMKKLGSPIMEKLQADSRVSKGVNYGY